MKVFLPPFQMYQIKTNDPLTLDVVFQVYCNESLDLPSWNITDAETHKHALNKPLCGKKTVNKM